MARPIGALMARMFCYGWLHHGPHDHVASKTTLTQRTRNKLQILQQLKRTADQWDHADQRSRNDKKQNTEQNSGCVLSQVQYIVAAQRHFRSTPRKSKYRI